MFFLRPETTVQYVNRVIYHHTYAQNQGCQRNNIQREAHKAHCNQRQHDGNRNRCTYNNRGAQISIKQPQNEHGQENRHNHGLIYIADGFVDHVTGIINYGKFKSRIRCFQFFKFLGYII